MNPATTDSRAVSFLKSPNPTDACGQLNLKERDFIDRAAISEYIPALVVASYSPCKIRPMGAALDVIQQGYAAFGRRDIPALLKLVADEVDWKEVCPASLPYSGLRRNPA